MPPTKDRKKRRRPLQDNRRKKKKLLAHKFKDDEYVDYKDVALLRKFMSDRGKIRSRRVTGLTTQRQRQVAIAIRNAREMALLPYTQQRQ